MKGLIIVRERVQEVIVTLFPLYTRQCLLAIGCIAIVLAFTGIFHEKDDQITSITRPEFKDTKEVFTVYAEIDGRERIPIQLKAEPIKPTEQEAQKYLEDVNQRWREILDGYYSQNPEITSALKTYNAINGENIGIQIEGYWHSMQSIDEEGYIDLGGWTEGTREFTYNSTWIYQEAQLSDSYTIIIERSQIGTVYENKWYRQKIQGDWETQETKTESKQKVELPTQEQIRYFTEAEEHWGIKSLGILILIAMLLMALSRNEKKEKEILYEKDMRCHFMYLTQDMVMLYQSGATLYTALRLSLMQRQPLLKQGTRQKEVIEGLCDMLDQEQSMREVMLSFKDIFEFREGKSFSRLMIQGSYYGDHQLSEQLSRISDNMWDERIRRARKESEKASSKLMFPMLIIFIVIIMLTVIPTFLEVGQM